MSDALVGIMMMEEATAHRGATSALEFLHQPAFCMNINRLYDGQTVRKPSAGGGESCSHNSPRHRAKCASEASTATC
jgi:hypothetical protein